MKEDYKKVGQVKFHIQAVKDMGKDAFLELYKGKQMNLAPYSLEQAFDVITADEEAKPATKSKKASKE